MFQDVQSGGQDVRFRLGQEQVDVLGHEDVAVNVEVVPGAEPFQLSEEEETGGVVVEQRSTAVATEGDEVVGSTGLVPFEIGGHLRSGSLTSYIPTRPQSARTDGAPRLLW
jgi:hypothetical protein